MRLQRVRRVQRAAVLFLALPACCFCQQPDEPLDRAEALETLERLAPAMPNEFAADMLLQISQLPGQGTRRRRELLEEAFAYASRVSDPRAPRLSLNWNRDTRAGHRQYASRPEIDALSLRVRIALAMAYFG
ncbi:MAG: hypothetical protein IPM24_16940 [Bryobacterales bacterium]|nr:hypothetical protein [Bryobacterales bacterium]